jgi:hypothetical protein
MKLFPIEEEIIIFIRTYIGLSIRDIGIVLNNLFTEKNKLANRDIKYSRHSVDECIKRYNLKTPLERLKEEEKQRKKEERRNNINSSLHKFQEVNKPGFIHIDFKYLPRIKEINKDYELNKKNNNNGDIKDNKKYNSKRSFAFTAIDRYSRYVYTEILTDKSVDKVAEFLKNVIEDFKIKTDDKYKIEIILTDNGGEFTDRFAKSKIKKELDIAPNKPSGTHKFDLICKEHNIIHRLTKPYHPYTNGMMEKYNGRIAQSLRERKAFLGDFKSQKEMFDFVMEIGDTYNNTKLQCINYKSPTEMMKKAIENKDEILKKEDETTEENHKTSELTSKMTHKTRAIYKTRENKNMKEWTRGADGDKNKKEIDKEIFKNKDDNVKEQNTQGARVILEILPNRWARVIPEVPRLLRERMKLT